MTDHMNWEKFLLNSTRVVVYFITFFSYTIIDLCIYFFFFSLDFMFYVLYSQYNHNIWHHRRDDLKEKK